MTVRARAPLHEQLRGQAIDERQQLRRVAFDAGAGNGFVGIGSIHRGLNPESRSGRVDGAEHEQRRAHFASERSARLRVDGGRRRHAVAHGAHDAPRVHGVEIFGALEVAAQEIDHAFAEIGEVRRRARREGKHRDVVHAERDTASCP